MRKIIGGILADICPLVAAGVAGLVTGLVVITYVVLRQFSDDAAERFLEGRWFNGR